MLVSDIGGEVTLSAKDVRSDYNKRGFDWNHIDFFVKTQCSGQLHAQYSDCAAFWGRLTPGRDMKIAVCGLILTEFRGQIARTNVNQWH